MKRRNFLLLAAAASLGAIAGPRLAPAFAAGSGLFLYDRRFSTGHTALPGARIVATGADVSPVWFTEIRPYLMASSAPVTGLTLGDTLFCLSRLAADLSWRIADCHVATTGTRVPIDHVTASAPYRWTLVPRTSLNMKVS
ncbi:hypothetical protein [Rhizobium alvei]|uniref:Uncharacterized protein n=1 Tax=Rhizobium alvei TaxID=1132659 RepID=A0ABT8YR48_9HYPH|nr:hypothetical protein [Rhizobium alvei]MDO6966153.1 hypothetical protein [Rhizobium alvei]